MTQRVRVPSYEAALASLDERLRPVEKATCGPWIYVGMYPLTPGTSPESPPFEGDWAGKLRFRWLRDLGVEIQGDPAGGSVGETIVILPDSPFYRPDFDLWFPATNETATLIVMKLTTLGELIYVA